MSSSSSPVPAESPPPPPSSQNHHPQSSESSNPTPPVTSKFRSPLGEKYHSSFSSSSSHHEQSPIIDSIVKQDQDDENIPEMVLSGARREHHRQNAIHHSASLLLAHRRDTNILTTTLGQTPNTPSLESLSTFQRRYSNNSHDATMAGDRFFSDALTNAARHQNAANANFLSNSTHLDDDVPPSLEHLLAELNAVEQGSFSENGGAPAAFGNSPLLTLMNYSMSTALTVYQYRNLILNASFISFFVTQYYKKPIDRFMSQKIFLLRWMYALMRTGMFVFVMLRLGPLVFRWFLRWKRWRDARRQYTSRDFVNKPV